MRTNLAIGIIGALLLASCSRQGLMHFGEALLLDRSEPTFEVNAIRPIWSCAKSPDPRYPCVGIGPEGFARDLVIKPFANKRVVTIKDPARQSSYEIRWTWFSMVGSCSFPNATSSYWDEAHQVMRTPMTLIDGRAVYDARGKRPGGESGLTKASAERDYEMHWKKRDERAGRTGKAVWPPQPVCTAHYIDQTAGRPFNMALWIDVPEPTDGIHDESYVKPSKSGRFATGCRSETRNGLTWRMCRTSDEKPEGPNGPLEIMKERWVAPLGDSGFFATIIVRYTEPLFLWPQWYAERQAAFFDVVDSLHYETRAYVPNSARAEE